MSVDAMASSTTDHVISLLVFIAYRDWFNFDSEFFLTFINSVILLEHLCRPLCMTSAIMISISGHPFTMSAWRGKKQAKSGCLRMGEVYTIVHAGADFHGALVSRSHFIGGGAR
jgi:hypothetical protein